MKREHREGRFQRDFWKQNHLDLVTEGLPEFSLGNCAYDSARWKVENKFILTVRLLWKCVVLPFPSHSHQTLTFPIKYSIGKTFRKCWVNKGRDFFLKASIEFLRVFNVLTGTAFSKSGMWCAVLPELDPTLFRGGGTL